MKINIQQAKGLDVNIAQGPTIYSCTSYNNLQALCNKSYYPTYHIWNFNEIRIQASKKSRTKVLTKRGSNQMSNNIFKS